MNRQEIFRRESARIKENSERRDTSNWRPKEGDQNNIRILPHWSGDENEVFYYKFKRHFAVGPQKRWVVCLKTVDPEARCPICEAVERLKSSESVEDKKAAKEMLARERFAMNVLDLNEKEKGVQVWELAPGTINSILAFFGEPEYGDMDHLVRGRSIKINRVGKSVTDTKYFIIPSTKEMPLNPKVLEKCKDLEKLFAPPTFEEAAGYMEDDRFEGGDDASDVFDVPAGSSAGDEPEEETGDDIFGGTEEPDDDFAPSLKSDKTIPTPPHSNPAQPSPTSRAANIAAMKSKLGTK